MKRKLLTIKNLDKNFLNRKNSGILKKSYHSVLKDINMTINEGEIFGLVGESGSGKSTIGMIAGGIIDSSHGEVKYFDDSIDNNNMSDEMRKSIQIIFQNPYASLNPKMKIGYILKEPLIINNVGTEEEKEKMVDEMLSVVGLDKSIKNRYPKYLSGGQRQRIAIGRALMLKPKFLICDEPVSALDVSVQGKILNLMKKLQREFNLTYLFISHNLNIVYYMCDTIGVLYKGELIEYGSTKRIYEDPYHPYTKLLLKSIPKFNKNYENVQIEIKKLSKHPCAFYNKCNKRSEECKTKMPKLIEVEKNHFVKCNMALA